MNLALEDMWSPDLDPPSSGLPDDLSDFDVFMHMSLNEVGTSGAEVFSFQVMSPSALARTAPGRFLSHVLVLEQFSWNQIQTHLEKLLRHTRGCSTWDCVLLTLSSYVHYADAEPEAF
jgi:hypothetical protein